MKTVFLRVVDSDDKAAALREMIQRPEMARGTSRYEVDTATFAAVPRSPFAYWASESLCRMFSTLHPFEADGRTAKVGLGSSDDFRFMRAWWGVASVLLGQEWIPLVKGGAFSPFYSDAGLVVRWQRGSTEGRELKAFAETTPGTSHWSRRIASAEFYFLPGITWPVRATGFSPSPVPKGCIFSVRGYLATSHREDLMWLLGLMASAPFEALFRLGLSGERPEYVVGVLAAVPVPSSNEAQRETIAELSNRAWSSKRALDTSTETSHAFTMPALLQVQGDSVGRRASMWAEYVREMQADVSLIKSQLDECCFELYDLNESDRQRIAEASADRADDPGVPSEGREPDDVAEMNDDAKGLVADLVSWAAGVAFGRFDVRLATGARALPAEPAPFDPLPACSPAMLTGEDGLPLESAPFGYPVAFHGDGILVDDPGDSRDLTAAVRAVFDVVFGARADAIWEEVAALLAPKNQSLRQWLASGFFEHHLKRHSKSRRKAPIVWQLGVPSGRYSVWLYAHRLTGDRLFQVQNDVVAPKLVHEERRLTNLIQNSGGSSSSKERKEIAAQETFVEELRALLEEIKRVAPLWSPTLDDGVVLAMAPLWRLVAQHKPWQRELKTKWEELIAGEYDWAHTAMSLWPERVVPKCATDRSFAIAHGLEDTFWVEGSDGKWEPRSVPTRPVEELINERSSLAIQAALQAGLDRPAVPAGDRRRAPVV
jgi:hypothetical protein